MVLDGVRGLTGGSCGGHRWPFRLRVWLGRLGRVVDQVVVEGGWVKKVVAVSGEDVSGSVAVALSVSADSGAVDVGDVSVELGGGDYRAPQTGDH
jgi:hypothetical protein